MVEIESCTCHNIMIEKIISDCQEHGILDIKEFDLSRLLDGIYGTDLMDNLFDCVPKNLHHLIEMRLETLVFLLLD